MGFTLTAAAARLKKSPYQMRKPGNTDGIQELEGYGMQGKVEICGVNTAKLTTLSNAERTIQALSVQLPRWEKAGFVFRMLEA